MWLLRSDDHRIVSWKNGGGVTRELASHREDGGSEDFLWRVSIATVDRDGPFSRFDGVDRTIAVLAGDGLRLATPTDEVDLLAGGEPYSFNGETPVEASVITAATTDLNVMTRRGRFRHAMERLRFDGATTVIADTDETIIVFNGPMTAETSSTRFETRTLDSLHGMASGERVRLYAEGETEAFLIRLSGIPASE